MTQNFMLNSAAYAVRRILPRRAGRRVRAMSGSSFSKKSRATSRSKQAAVAAAVDVPMGCARSR